MRRTLAQRDQAESAFSSILEDLVRRLPGARAAALVDLDGETVDYACRSDPFEVRLAAAHLRLVLHELQAAYGPACVLAVRGAARSYWARSLPQGYALTVVLSCGAATVGSCRAMAICVTRLAAEAGWEAPPAPRWHPVDVLADDRGRPVALGTAPYDAPVEILGVIARGLARFERGWRVRLRGGEATIVREPSGHFYIDDAHLV